MRTLSTIIQLHENPKRRCAQLFTARILVILFPPITAEAAAETIARAIETAVRPAGLRFAVPHTMEQRLSGLPEGAEPLFYDAAQGLSGVVPRLTEETHFLFLTGPHAFHPRWDARLYGQWRQFDKHTLLTSSITPSPVPAVGAFADSSATIRVPAVNGSRLAALRKLTPALQKRSISTPEDAPRGILPHLRHNKPAAASVSQAHLPALKEVQEDGGILLGRGLALVCAAEPVKTLVIDPCFLFGPVVFLLEGESLDAEFLSLTAYLTGYTVYALSEVFAWPVHAQPPNTLRLPLDALPGTTLARFEQLLGFHSVQRRCDAKTAMGLFGHEDTYPQRMPPKLMVKHKTRAATMKLLETHMPLMVSAFIDLPNPRVESAFYLLRFGFLRRIQSLPLLLYTGGSQERALRAAFPHTQSYPDNTLLPKTLLQSGMKPDEYFARSKTLLMNKAAKRQIEFTHTAWVDMDILPHPVCAEAVPDFRSLMDDRIHIATVNGVPDPSFVVVPVDRLPLLAQLAQSITQLDAELKRGFSEPLLWERIFHRKPQWFAIHPMPRRRLLFLTAFDPQLLTQTVRPFLKDLPKPYYAQQADAPHKPEKETNPHES